MRSQFLLEVCLHSQYILHILADETRRRIVDAVLCGRRLSLADTAQQHGTKTGREQNDFNEFD